MNKLIFITIILFSLSSSCFTQETYINEPSKFNPFIAYELGEAVFNDFQSISFEVGARFNNDHLIRLVHMNVDLTETHLSSSFAQAVKGSNVEGSFFGFELIYDFPITWNTLYIGPSAGYFTNKYNHTILDEFVNNSSSTLGLSISYRERNIFGIKGVYFNFSLPMRVSLNPIEETYLGDAIVSNSTFENNIWLFIGYEF